MANDYKFVDAGTEEIVTAMVAAYESLVGRTISPASPERLFIGWCASVIVQTRDLINFAANQNIPSRAVGANLDALAELFYAKTRPQATAAQCTMRFTISAAQSSTVIIPAGTRVTDNNRALIWATTEDAEVPIGDTTTDVLVTCQTVGVNGNDWSAGQITELVDVFPYYESCRNITVSDGGADMATDEEFRTLLISSEAAYSVAGSEAAYIYWAKTASTAIKDVQVICPSESGGSAGEVWIYGLMNDGSIPSTEIKARIFAACNAEEVRPLTDMVSVKDPTLVPYDINLTYYIPSGSDISTAEIEAAVTAAVEEYKAWQAGKLGRDINPSKLISLLMTTGIKRVDVTSPVYTALADASDNTPPELASIGTVTIVNGGFEDE